jgi:putative membrane protein insertion efficiency factor
MSLLPKKLAVFLIDAYRLAISPFLPGSCRFTPTCSSYSREAIELYGLGRGSWLTLKRLLKCHPFHPGGHDPVRREQPHSKQAG